jgi:hypothetical protein
MSYDPRTPGFYSPGTPATAPAQQNVVYTPPQQTPALPYMECAHCPSPIQVGERFVYIVQAVLAMDASGQLVMAPPHDVEGPAVIHEDCSAEYCHDMIQKDRCGQNDNHYCSTCGNMLDRIEDDD